MDRPASAGQSGRLDGMAPIRKTGNGGLDGIVHDRDPMPDPGWSGASSGVAHDPDGGRARVVAVRDGVGCPERFAADETFIPVNGWNELGNI